MQAVERHRGDFVAALRQAPVLMAALRQEPEPGLGGARQGASTRTVTALAGASSRGMV